MTLHAVPIMWLKGRALWCLVQLSPKSGGSKAKPCCPLRKSGSAVLCSLFPLKMPSISDKTIITTAATLTSSSHVQEIAFRNCFLVSSQLKRRWLAIGTNWKCFLLVVGKMDELHFRVEMKAIQLSTKVTLILGIVTGPDLHSEGGGCDEKSCCKNVLCRW